ncbi:hypothetical protein GPECTOR_9g526 [Gonium pectorale]|uniref:DNA 3'-5' helicase n=1 Tax=Gonium pectorale TaxID=33097 RepID=A0A150GRU8_GONPE|nr:hypothetical protein GPECTOR_9g526 [Gonium pectorale]|eukprot:KXZ52482.1 hypothetical protein GPECTOR_9g526 [Gonium pectorale]
MASTGFSSFRGRQEDAVLGALAGRDVLVIMPTGGGKTVCYVIPALVQPGLCVVVSPLLALMQDQVANLRAVGVRAEQLSSALPAAQRAAVLEELAAGCGGKGGQPDIKLLLVTPELLAASERFRTLLRRLHAARNLSLFAIDESHCISTWGHDFRPAYRRLQALRHDYPGVPIMALTATAASQVQDDICNQLRLSSPLRLLSSFNRPNIAYSVRYLDVEAAEAAGMAAAAVAAAGKGAAAEAAAEGADEMGALIRLLKQRRTAGGSAPCSIVYCQKRDTCEEVAARLCREGLPAAAYHGQMAEAAKQKVLQAWQADEVPIVAATIAFGMGIDKAGVRLVVHFNLPRSLEGFYQEAGRAGRDGAPAESVMFYRQVEDQQDKEGKAAKKAQPRGKGAAVGSGAGGLDCEEGAVAASADEEAQVQATAWQSIAAQLARLEELQVQAAAERRGWGGAGRGGSAQDEEGDMFAVRGGAGVGAGGDDRGRGDQEEFGPGFINAGRADAATAADAAVRAEARCAAAAARSAAGGQVNDRYFAALEAREREHERRLKGQGAGDVVDRMLTSGSGGGRGSTPAQPPDAAARANATNKLAAALAGNRAVEGLEGGLVQRLAAAVEGDVYGSGLPRQQYTSRMAGLLTRAKAAPSALALLPQAPQAPGAGSAAPAAAPAAAQSSAASTAALLPELLQAELAALERILGGDGASGAPGAAAGAGAGGSGKACALGRLRAMAGVAVTVAAVAGGGVGKRAARLGKHADAEVAEAARAVVASWKRQLPEPAGPKPGAV